MGKGNGGYAATNDTYKDSGGKKVTDRGAIFVAERYIDAGFVVVFRQRHEYPTPDLTIKDTADIHTVKHIEVKQITSDKPSQTAKRIKEAFVQVGCGGTVALDYSKFSNTDAARRIAQAGFEEAKRKGNVHGKVEIWIRNKTREELN